MKNIELFEQIKQLVRQKQQIQVQSSSFAQKYCQQQLSRKRLTPYDSRHKMNHLMKNFQQLETYVDVRDLIGCINRNTILQRNKEKKQKEKQREKQNHKEKEQKENNNNPIDISSVEVRGSDNGKNQIQALKDKIKQRLGKQLVNKYDQESHHLSQIIQSFQKQKLNRGYLKNHNSEYNLQHSLGKCMLSKQIPWDFQQIHNNKDNLDEYSFPGNLFDRTDCSDLQSNKDRIQLVHTVSTYLQIILESKHKKKWMRKQNTKIGGLDGKTNKTLKRGYLNSSTKEADNVSNSKDGEFDYENHDQSRVLRRSDRSGKENAGFNQDSGFRTANIKRIGNWTGRYQQVQTQSPIHIKHPKLSKVSSTMRSMSSFRRQSNTQRMTDKQLVNYNFTFRNRNIKDGLLKKMDKFIDLVQEEEKIFKENNKNHINNIQKLENDLKTQYTKYKNDPILDQQGFKAIRIRALEFK